MYNVTMSISRTIDRYFSLFYVYLSLGIKVYNVNFTKFFIEIMNVIFHHEKVS